MAEDNVAKAKALTDSFFPLPLPSSWVLLNAAYPPPLKEYAASLVREFDKSFNH